MEELVQKTTVAEAWEKLHQAIENGDLETVRNTVDSHAEEQSFSFDETSALYRAFQSKNYEIISFLIHKGAKFVGSEESCVYHFDIDLDRVNLLLFEYNKKSERSSIHRVISLSQSPQGLDGETLHCIVSMYERLHETDVIKVLMEVLERETFDVVYDFHSESVNRMHRLNEEEAEIFGLTLSSSKEIFVGAKDLLSGDPRKRAKVYGVVAEELCHLAMTTVFKNNAKPYKEEDSDLIQEFHEILLSLKASIDRSSRVETVIQDVFAYYSCCSWECELIARVPHVFGMYGEELGRRIFRDSSELYKLLLFYEQNVLPKCREYIDSLSNTKSDRIMKQLTGKSEFISFREKRICPLKEDFPSFKHHVVVESGVSVISSNCIKLSALNVYHELKPVYGDRLERKCLFFGGKGFEKKRAEILKALKCKLCDYFVLVLDDKELQHRRLLCEYLDEFEPIINQGINVIIITNSLLLGPDFQEKALEYKWDDLTEEYKDLRTRCTEYLFKGERKEISIKKEIVPELFSEKEIIAIITGDLLEVQDGADLYSQGYNSETYVERQFQATVIDGKLFQELPPYTCIYINGLRRWELKELSIDESLVQSLEGPDDETKNGKAVFISDKDTNFKDFMGRTPFENSICLQYDRKRLYLVNSVGDVCKQYEREVRLTEEEMIDLLKSSRSLIISENAGCGKSTVMSSLIRYVRMKIYNSWVLRVDLNRFSMKDEGSDREEDDEKDVFKDIFAMLGLKDGIEKCLFMDGHNQDKYFIFLDAFDEIPSEYKTKALKVISFLRENTDVRIMITTRMHHQQELEEVLHTFSLQLVPFDNSSKVNCLGKLWKWKLKFPSGERGRFPQRDKKAISRKIRSIIRELEKEKTDSESHGLLLALKEITLEDSIDSISRKIDGLEFNRLANSILCKTSLARETLQFMGIPLHLYMIGAIYFDGNFNVEIQSDIYGIYSKFVDHKILIYVEEKQGISYHGRGKKSVIEKGRSDAYRIHTDLANQLMEKGSIGSEMSEEDLELCSALGIVFIKGTEIDFLHWTFAEFFQAESVRLNVKRSFFFRMFLYDKYKVVRTFLSSALERRTYENIEREVTEDVEFLVHILAEIAHRLYIYPHSPVIPKIVRKLFERMEKAVVSDFLNRFFFEFERALMRSHSKMYFTGGCLSVEMLKALLNRNVDRRIVLGMVGYYSNPAEAIEVLTECISIGMAVEGSNEGKTGGNERENALLKLLKTEDSVGGLLQHALLNPQAEIFANILSFSRDVLGRDRFVREIVQSDEYRKQVLDFVTRVSINRVCAVLRELYCVFGSEICSIIDLDSKHRIIDKGLRVWMNWFHEDEVPIEFEELIGVLVGYFGREDLEKVLLSCDSDGNYLFHSLALWFFENRTKNLNLIGHFLGDGGKLRQLLKRENRDLRNVLHCAASNNVAFFGKFFQFISVHLDTDDIKELFSSTDKKGNGVMQLLVRQDEYETLIENLDLVKNAIADLGWFRTFLKKKDGNLRGLFHFAGMHTNFGDLLQFCRAYLEEDELKEMLLSVDGNGEDAWRFLPAHIYSEKVIRNLGVLRDALADDDRFEPLLKRKDERSRNVFHCAAHSGNFGAVLTFCNDNLEKDVIKQMLEFPDEKGESVLHLLLEHHSFEALIGLLDLIKDTVADGDWFKDFLKKEDAYDRLVSKMFDASAGMQSKDFGAFLRLCIANLEKNEVQEMFLGEDKYGRTMLHLLLENNSSRMLIENLEATKGALNGCGWFRRFLSSSDGDLRNAFHFAGFMSDFGVYLRYWGTNLEKEGFKKLLVSCDSSGKDPLRLLFEFGSTETVSRNLSVLKDTLLDDKWFKELLKSRDCPSRTIFYSAAVNRNKINFSFLGLHLQKREVVQLLVQGVYGRTCLHFVAESQPRNLPFWLDYTYGTLKDMGSQFQELILSVNVDGDSFLHVVHKSSSADLFCVKHFDFKETAHAILVSLREKLPVDVYEKLLRIRNYNGLTFLGRKGESGREIGKSFRGFVEKHLLEEIAEPMESPDPVSSQYALLYSSLLR